MPNSYLGENPMRNRIIHNCGTCDENYEFSVNIENVKVDAKEIPSEVHYGCLHYMTSILEEITSLNLLSKILGEKMKQLGVEPEGPVYSLGYVINHRNKKIQ